MPSLFSEEEVTPQKSRKQTAKPAPLRLKTYDPDPLEAWHQETLFNTVELHLSLIPALHDLYAVPNGGWRHPATAKALKKQGTRKGVPDMALDVPCRGYHGLKIELKRFKNGEIEPEQEERLTRNAANGYRAVVCWGWKAAWEEILWYVGREDLLLPSNHITTQIVKAYPADPFWQRKRIPPQIPPQTRFS